MCRKTEYSDRNNEDTGMFYRYWKTNFLKKALTKTPTTGSKYSDRQTVITQDSGKKHSRFSY